MSNSRDLNDNNAFTEDNLKSPSVIDNSEMRADSDLISGNSEVNGTGFEMETNDVMLGIKNRHNGDQGIYDIENGQYINAQGIEKKILKKNESRDRISNETKYSYRKDFYFSGKEIYWQHGNKGDVIHPILIDDNGRAYFQAEIDSFTNKIKIKLEVGRELQLNLTQGDFNLLHIADVKYAIDVASVHSLLQFTANNQRLLSVHASAEMGVLGPNAGASVCSPEICLFGLGFQCDASINAGAGLKAAVGGGITIDKTQLRLRPYIKVGGYSGVGAQTEIKFNIGLDTNASNRISETNQALMNSPEFGGLLADINKCIQKVEQEKPDTFLGKAWNAFQLHCYRECKDEIRDNMAHIAASNALFSINVPIQKTINNNKEDNAITNISTSLPVDLINPNVTPDIRDNETGNPENEEILNKSLFDEIKSKIYSDYNYSQSRKSMNIFPFYIDTHKPVDESNTSFFWDHCISGGSLHVSNDNPQGQIRLHIDLPLPLGIFVLGIRKVYDKIKDLKYPNELQGIYNSLELLNDSYKKVSFSFAGVQNLFRKNFNWLSKSALIERRQQEILFEIEKLINVRPDDYALRMECSYIISAIKNNYPEMLNFYSSGEDISSGHEKLYTQYKFYLDRDITNFESLSENQSIEALCKIAKDLNTKYPYEARVHEILAITFKNAGNYEMALNEIEKCRLLRNQDINEMHKNKINDEPEYFTGNHNPADDCKTHIKQYNLYIKHWKIGSTQI